ncbi:hypothetical protein KUCAC02_017626 [Chaenocephalus aceratus]|uniref:Uncharacterized protein n=1 Tax=Chaenocephalus aceratus TaxID=36190 RepID=A0ACB9W1S4_CHAAC|nr:hypothetical protein KUCAC02_017626 [Chaenocephalus aceratus]
MVDVRKKKTSRNSVAAKSGGCFPRILHGHPAGWHPEAGQTPPERGQGPGSGCARKPDKITLTAAHLLFVGQNNTDNTDEMSAVFASQVQTGQTVFVFDAERRRLEPACVKRIFTHEYEGSFAPVTVQGTVVVDQVLASCYAVIQDHDLAHWALAPVRFFYWVNSLLYQRPTSAQPDGVHWYSKILFQLGTWLLDSHSIHPLGMSVYTS